MSSTAVARPRRRRRKGRRATKSCSLKQVLADKQTELDALKAAAGRARVGGTVAASIAPQGLAMGATPAWTLAAACAVALACGFWLGYAMLARRIRQKFGGLRVY